MNSKNTNVSSDIQNNEASDLFQKVTINLQSAVPEKAPEKKGSRPKAGKNNNGSAEENESDISEETLNRFVKDANQYLLISVLSPEVKKNENRKREHKGELMIMIKYFLGGQFLLVALIVCYSLYRIIQYQTTDNAFTDETIKLIFTFIGAYITSVVVELIAILKYLVQNVFDTSISDLVKFFKSSVDMKETEEEKPTT